MISNKALLLLAAATFLTLAHGHKPPKTTTTTLPTTTTTLPTTTTAVPPETTTPSTTTVTPETTTTASTTTSVHTTTTIPDTTTATTPATSTTMAPPVNPVPAPMEGKWAFYDSKNNTCVIIQMAVQLNVTYVALDKSIKYAVFNIPKNETHVKNGSCGDTQQFITLSWPAFNGSSNDVTFTFSKNNASSPLFVVDNLEFAVVEDSVNFPGSNESNVVKKLSHNCNISVSLQKSYRCSKKQVIVLDPVGKNNSTVTIVGLQIQAFHSEKGDKFDSAEDCEMADVSDVVPIAVGCALGGLVLIVLITYLIGRRRQRGYLSM